MKEGFPERFELTYGWHLKMCPGGPVGGDVGLDERKGSLPLRAGAHVSMDGIAVGFRAADFGELDS